MELSLNASERELLLEILEEHHRELLREIAKTKHHEFKELLRAKEKSLETMLNKLEVMQRAAPLSA